MGIYLKKLGSVLIVATLACLPSQAMSVAAVGAGAAALTGATALSSVLVPIILPIATKIATESGAQLQSALKNLSSKDFQCKKLCELTSRVSCNTKKGTSFCKGRCQKIIKVGAGYTLKIRYTEKWNLHKCMIVATQKGKHVSKASTPPPSGCTPTGSQSIAIYGEDDYNTAIKVVSKLAALDEFILFDGNVEQTQGKTPEEIEALVTKAKEDREKMNKAFQEYVQKNFGPQ